MTIIFATNCFFPELISGAMEYFRKREWLLNVTTVRFPGYLPAATGCAGILGSLHQASLRDWVIEKNCPMVHLLHSTLPMPAWPRVVCDRDAQGRLGARHFLELGSPHFAFYQGYDAPETDECREGFVREMRAHGHTVHVLHFQASAETIHSDQQLTISRADRVNWLVPRLRALPLPLAVMAEDDAFALDLVLAAHQLGLRIPDDLAILGTDNQALILDAVQEEISSMDVNFHEVGRLGSELLARMIDGAKPGSKEVPMLVKVPPRGVVMRQSTATFICDHPGVTAAAIFVRQHFHEPITVKDVASQAGMSLRSLQAEYPSRVKCTVKDDIQRARLRRAQYLLETTNLKLAAVASESGFKNAEYLCAVFQAKHQMTPHTWRVQARQGRRSPATEGAAATRSRGDRVENIQRAS